MAIGQEALIHLCKRAFAPAAAALPGVPLERETQGTGKNDAPPDDL